MPRLSNKTHKNSQLLFPKIAEEITAMRDKDQEAFSREKQDQKEINFLTKKHTTRLKEIIAEIGWPNTTKVGSLAAKNAWLLVQHANHDIEFQQECLSLMQQESENEVRNSDIAFLTDRILVLQNKPQRYGTQIYQERDAEGKLIRCFLMEVEEPELLEQRRTEMELEPMKEYLEFFAEIRGYNLEEIDLGNFAPYIIK